ncbi:MULTISPECIES: PepSY domain-containing protein [Brucella]|uniref:type IV secretion system effector VceA n=1 Tax=Brucella TaxID=234 RepID=UPI000870CDF8|nr:MULTISPECIES: PepSY domain-containing protein [Brucella]MRN44760.1 hypothetical protein [Brucella sp. 09RB8913]MRN59753.1 hypothetical protein [Brucella sp. 09RB8918]CAB4326786.1 putative Cytosolic Protein [Brucella sp. 191011898]SCD23485.1 hypothetical protein BR141012304_11062 [Brucella inopinata]
MKIIITAAALVALSATGAMAQKTQCDAKPLDEKSIDALVQLSNEFTWKISEMEIDNGCYELRVTDENGNVLKVKVDPETMKVVAGKVKRYGDGTPAKDKGHAPKN